MSMGTTFFGHASNVEVKVCYADGAEMTDYRYWVILATQVLRKDGSHSIQASPDAVASTLATGGFNVFIPSSGWGRIDWDQKGTHYRAENENQKRA